MLAIEPVPPSSQNWTNGRHSPPRRHIRRQTPAFAGGAGSGNQPGGARCQLTAGSRPHLACRHGAPYRGIGAQRAGRRLPRLDDPSGGCSGPADAARRPGGNELSRKSRLCVALRDRCRTGPVRERSTAGHPISRARMAELSVQRLCSRVPVGRALVAGGNDRCSRSQPPAPRRGGLHGQAASRHGRAVQFYLDKSPGARAHAVAGRHEISCAERSTWPTI